MEGKVDVKQALRVYQIIVDQGERLEEGYRYRGLTALSDFDGYNITIKNDYVSLTILFHNKIDFKFSNKRERIVFLETLDQIDKSKTRKRI